MPRKKSTRGPADQPKKLTADELVSLCARWSDLDEERLALDRQSANRVKEQHAIERQLVEQLQLEGKFVRKLGSDFEFGFQLVPGSMYYKVELIRAIGQEEFDRRQAAWPQQNKFFLTDKRPLAKKKKRGAA